jgi:hypothetical protein
MRLDSRGVASHVGGTYMTTTQKAEFTQRTLMALLTARAEQAELEKTISALTRSLADAHGISANYPPAC